MPGGAALGAMAPLVGAKGPVRVLKSEDYTRRWLKAASRTMKTFALGVKTPATGARD